MHADWFVWCFVGLIAIGFVITAMMQLTPNARLRRRRRKSHTRVVSKSHRPSVKLSVKPPKE